MKRVCVLALNDPFACPFNGGKKDIRGRLDALAMLQDVEVDLYVLSAKKDGKTEIDREKYNIANVFEYQVQDVTVPLFFSKWPVSVKRRWNASMNDELKKHRYDVCIYEGEYMALYRIYNSVSAVTHIIRMHNIESNYRFEISRSEKSIIKKVIQCLEGVKYRHMEKNLYSMFDRYLFISADEMKLVADVHHDIEDRLFFMPTAIGERGVNNYGIRNNEILYFGSLDISNNFWSLKWFIENVLPLIEKKHPVKLKVSGAISQGNKAVLESLSNNVEICGYTDNLEEEIGRAHFIILPVLYGAGVKVKIIEALSYGQIVVTNSKAVEGTTLVHKKHLLIYDDPKQMADACLDILDNRDRYTEIAVNGYEYFKKYHSVESQAEILNKIIH